LRLAAGGAGRLLQHDLGEGLQQRRRLRVVLLILQHRVGGVLQVPPGEAEVEQRRDRPRRKAVGQLRVWPTRGPLQRGEGDSAIANNDADGDPPLSCVEV